MSKSMDGKVSIVTGSATGLGAAVALKLAGRGSKVVINYTKSETEAKETQATCEKLGVETLLAQGDVSKDEDCRRIVADTVANTNTVANTLADTITDTDTVIFIRQRQRQRLRQRQLPVPL